MWELIKANRRKSISLFILMGLFLLILGYLIGEYLFYDGMMGIILATLIWLIQSAVSYFSGTSIVLAVSGAKKVTHDVHPKLFNIVEEMKLAAGLPVMPEVYIINSEAPNAFATGSTPNKCAIVVTAGLLVQLNRDELQGVVAHETSHILNRDVRFITFAAIMLGTIVLISELMLRGFYFRSGASRRYNNRSGSSQIQLIIIIVSIVFAILAPLLAQLLYFSISRKREYLADATAVQLTRFPNGLATALEKIAASNLDLKSANKVTAPMYIANPLKKKGMRLKDLTSTHPPISERIRILRTLAGDPDNLNYKSAYAFVKKSRTKPVMETGINKLSSESAIESAPAKIGADEIKNSKRELGNIMMAVNNYAFIHCTCGLKMKIPSGFNRNEVMCPKCGKMNRIIRPSA